MSNRASSTNSIGTRLDRLDTNLSEISAIVRGLGSSDLEDRLNDLTNDVSLLRSVNYRLAEEREVTDTGWISVDSFQNSFYSLPSDPVMVRRIGDCVYFRGQLLRAEAPGSTSIAAFSLTERFRPVTAVVSAIHVGWAATVVVRPTGVFALGATTARTSEIGYALGGVQYLAE